MLGGVVALYAPRFQIHSTNEKMYCQAQVYIYLASKQIHSPCQSSAANVAAHCTKVMLRVCVYCGGLITVEALLAFL